MSTDNGTSNGDRNSDGTFKRGHPGGPGRPRRAVERDYLKTLGDRVSPEAWGRIVDCAVADAEDGDAKARDFLARFVMPKPEAGSAPLLDAAADELAGIDRVARAGEDAEATEAMTLGPAAMRDLMGG